MRYTPFRTVLFFSLFAVGAVCLTMATPSAMAAGDTTFKVSGDWISQTPNQSDLDYAHPDSNPKGPIGSVARVDPGSDNGYRFRFEVMRGKASFFAAYTSYKTDAADEITSPAGNLTGTLDIDDYCQACNENISLASADWDVDYSLIDLGVAYDLRENSPLGLRVTGGVRQVSVEQNFHVLYSTTLAVTASSDFVDQGTDMDAFGLFLGLEPDYKFNSWVKLIGKFTYSTLKADADQTFVYNISINGGATKTLTADLSSGQNLMVQVIDVAVGVEFAIADHVSVSGGYELQTWQNYPGFMKHTSESGETTLDLHASDLGFDGAFVRVGVSF